MYLDVVPAVIDQGVILAEVYLYVIDAACDAVVLTPRCDLELRDGERKAQYLTVCAVRPAELVMRELVRTGWGNMLGSDGEFLQSPGANKAGNFKQSIRKLVTQNVPRFHWLSPYADRPLSVADFQMLGTFRPIELEAKARIAALRSPWAEEVLSRYVAHMGRVGVEDRSDAQIGAERRSHLRGLLPARQSVSRAETCAGVDDSSILVRPGCCHGCCQRSADSESRRSPTPIRCYKLIPGGGFEPPIHGFTVRANSYQPVTLHTTVSRAVGWQ